MLLLMVISLNLLFHTLSTQVKWNYTMILLFQIGKRFLIGKRVTRVSPFMYHTEQNIGMRHFLSGQTISTTS